MNSIGNKSYARKPSTNYQITANIFYHTGEVKSVSKAKKIFKIIGYCVTAVAIIHLIYVLCASINYQVYLKNELLPAFFENNKGILSEYENAFDTNDYADIKIDEHMGEIRYYDVPRELLKLKISDIKYTDSYLFFDISDGLYNTGGIYYSFNDEFAEAIPDYEDESELFSKDFQKKKEDVFIKGKKNSHANWYRTKRLAENWYTYEVYLGN